MARDRTIAGRSIPGIVIYFFWLVVAIVIIILLARLVHWAGGGEAHVRIGHFFLNAGFN
jgi:hypothetical protein